MLTAKIKPNIDVLWFLEGRVLIFILLIECNINIIINIDKSCPTNVNVDEWIFKGYWVRHTC